MQLFVRNIESCTLVCEVEATASVLDVKDWVERQSGIPSSSQGLVYGGRQLQDGLQLQSYGVGPDSTLHLVLRLRGGKGGFGALLRGQGRDGKITSNFDACRDLQGRRLKYSNTEKKLAEWKGLAKERELEKVALKHIKDVERQAKKEEEDNVDVDAIVKQQRQTMAKVQEAVETALAEGGGPSASSAAPGKRAAGRELASRAQPAQKKSKMMAALENFGSEDEESTSEDEA